MLACLALRSFINLCVKLVRVLCVGGGVCVLVVVVKQRRQCSKFFPSKLSKTLEFSPKM